MKYLNQVFVFLVAIVFSSTTLGNGNKNTNVLNLVKNSDFTVGLPVNWEREA